MQKFISQNVFLKFLSCETQENFLEFFKLNCSIHMKKGRNSCFFASGKLKVRTR